MSAPIVGFFKTTMCSHFAAVHLFTNSILNRCVYRGFSCESDEVFQQGQCILNAVHHYQISLVSDSNYLHTKAQIRLTFIGSRAAESVLLDS